MAYSLNRTYLGTKYYICNKYKTKNCQARLIVASDGTVKSKNEHTCVTENLYQEIDVREEMKRYLEVQCTKDLSILPTKLWEQAITEMNNAHANHPLITINKQYAINHINYIRRRIHGGDDYRAIETSPICNISDNDKRMFLQFNIYYSFNNTARRIIGFGHPDLIRLLNYPSISLFIDGTFKVTPAKFTQCFIVMMYDPSVDLYIPIFYILLDSKDQWTYSNVLHWVKVQCGFKIKPRTVTCDFEKGLINAINEQFNKTKIIGCLFHYKQALRRKLISLRINTNQIHEAMEIGKLDLLTIIPPNEIITYEILYIRPLINERDNESKLNFFWKYFIRTWMITFQPEFWNIHDAITEEIDLVNRIS